MHFMWGILAPLLFSSKAARLAACLFFISPLVRARARGTTSKLMGRLLQPALLLMCEDGRQGGSFGCIIKTEHSCPSVFLLLKLNFFLTVGWPEFIQAPPVTLANLNGVGGADYSARGTLDSSFMLMQMQCSLSSVLKKSNLRGVAMGYRCRTSLSDLRWFSPSRAADSITVRPSGCLLQQLECAAVRP